MGNFSRPEQANERQTCAKDFGYRKVLKLAEKLIDFSARFLEKTSQYFQEIHCHSMPNPFSYFIYTCKRLPQQ